MTMIVKWTGTDAKSDCTNNQLPARSPDIDTLRATAFNLFLASDEVIVGLALQIGECTGLLEATLEEITFSSADNMDPFAGHDE